MSVTAIKQPTDNWFRSLKNDRLEVCLAGRIDGTPLRIRASGPKDHIWKVVEMFEEMTGIEVVGEWKRSPRSVARPLAGQLSITEQLESSDVEE
jgi:hypothetical protein